MKPVARNLLSSLCFTATGVAVSRSRTFPSRFFVLATCASTFSFSFTTNGVSPASFLVVFTDPTRLLIKIETTPAMHAATAIVFLYFCQRNTTLPGSGVSREMKPSFTSLPSTFCSACWKFLCLLYFPRFCKKMLCSTTAWSSSGLFFRRSSK